MFVRSGDARRYLVLVNNFTWARCSDLVILDTVKSRSEACECNLVNRETSNNGIGDGGSACGEFLYINQCQRVAWYQ